MERVASGELEVARHNLSQWGKITIVTGLNKMAQHGRLASQGAAGCNSHCFSENSIVPEQTPLMPVTGLPAFSICHFLL